MQPKISVWVRDPRMRKNDFWHAYMDYEICLHTNSVFFNKKVSSVRRRYSEFVWLRQKLQENALLMIQVPKLPPKNPFFSMNNAQQVTERMTGLQRFLEQILLSPLLMSDSCLHLFLQSTLSVPKMEACAAGKTNYSVAQAVQSCGLRRFHSEEALDGEEPGASGDSDSDSSQGADAGARTKHATMSKTESAPAFALLGSSQGEPLGCSSGST